MENDALIFEQVIEAGFSVRRIGRSKITGVILLECKMDEKGREIEKIYYDDNGLLNKKIIYEYDDQDRRPLLTSVFSSDGKLLRKQERGKRPESFE
jgi:hypothetical protein